MAVAAATAAVVAVVLVVAVVVVDGEAGLVMPTKALMHILC